MNFFDLLNGGTVLRKKAKSARAVEPSGAQHQHSLFIDHYTPAITEEDRQTAADIAARSSETTRQVKVRVSGV